MGRERPTGAGGTIQSEMAGERRRFLGEGTDEPNPSAFARARGHDGERFELMCTKACGDGDSAHPDLKKRSRLLDDELCVARRDDATESLVRLDGPSTPDGRRRRNRLACAQHTHESYQW